MSEGPIYLEKDGELAWLTIDRPDKHNALSQAMWEAIPHLTAQAEADPAIKVLVVRGAAPKAFSAGADISEFEVLNTDAALRDANRAAITQGLRALTAMTKPTIAMVRGICMGGGCAIALTCDIRFASPEARFGIPPARLGLAYTLEDMKQLVDVVGPSHAKSMMFTGRAVAADEALAIGLATALYPLDEIEAQTRAFAAQICRNSQYSVRALKRVIGLIADGALAETEESWALAMGAYEGEDYREGVAAFLGKRPPRFTFS
ncbi:enoyl-CoA hydratase-related protein [Iodidimonas sp. SYSU 1G8]|uniref:enoyl-CoA hydratase-related protein n=1 Tax=Iodidimonas sp. SYSU 1G8 TaxID=3133967 RepID=UPI0031FEEC51